MNHNYDQNYYKHRSKQEQIKILIIGDSSVGKSSMLLRFTNGSFSGNYLSTVGIDFKIKSIEINGKIYKLQIWDSAGQERFATITKNYFRGAMGIIVVYDVTRRESFDMVGKWLSDISLICDYTTSVVLVGNKIDIIDQINVTNQEGKTLADMNNIDFFECSSMTGKNINEIFYHISDKIIQAHGLNKPKELKDPKLSPKLLTSAEQTKSSMPDERTTLDVNNNSDSTHSIKLKKSNSDKTKKSCCG